MAALVWQPCGRPNLAAAAPASAPHWSPPRRGHVASRGPGRLAAGCATYAAAPAHSSRARCAVGRAPA
eukprot:7389134-Prymnesium_polylepis.2